MNVTSDSDHPVWRKFSPFFSHGEVPMPAIVKDNVKVASFTVEAVPSCHSNYILVPVDLQHLQFSTGVAGPQDVCERHAAKGNHAEPILEE